MRSQPRIVPWATNEEFLQVFHWLYADIDQDPASVQRGIDRVLAWNCRGRVPIAVKATMDLVELQLRERKQVAAAVPLSQNELQLLYGCVMTRFVNILEDSQQKGYFARSLYVIAQQIGLPLHFVQIRHAATHEDLPSLTVLRRASRQALQWLYNTYWCAQIKPDTLHTVSAATMDEITAHLAQYKADRKTYLRAKESTAHRATVATMRKLLKLLTADTIQDSVIPILLRPGNLVPASKKKRPSAEELAISPVVTLLWMPLLQFLDSEFDNFLPELLSAMIARLDATDAFDMRLPSLNPFEELPEESDAQFKQPSYLMTLTCWLIFFISNSNTEESMVTQMILDLVLEECLRRPNAYTQSILKVLMQQDEELKTSLVPFMQFIGRVQQLQNGHAATPSAEGVDVEAILVKDNDDALKKQFRELRAKLGLEPDYSQPVGTEVVSDASEAMQDVESGGWRLCSEEEWSSCPIGCLPGGKVPDLDLTPPSMAIQDMDIDLVVAS
ncbi:Las1-like-domain-containing protein [Gongronella butleri]|nr:Las1-like-domain-containing protein [Gongronella butleri]